MRKVAQIITLLFLVLGLTACKSTENNEKALFDRLGGVYSIAPLIDDFIERLLVNEMLNENPAIKASRDRLPKAGLKFRVTALVCEVTGGPQKYFGRTMKVAHAKLNISEKEWKYMMADFQESLNKFKVPSKEQAELFDIMEKTKPHVVTVK